MQRINNIGYPYRQTNTGLFNPGNTVLDNTRSKLLVLLSTLPGLRPLAYNCQFGINMHQILFLNQLYSSDEEIKSLIARTIKQWIPEITSIVPTIERILNNIRVYIQYTVSGQTDTVNMELSNNE